MTVKRKTYAYYTRKIADEYKKKKPDRNRIARLAIKAGNKAKLRKVKRR